MADRRRWARDGALVAASFLAGSIPFSQMAARATRGADLRKVGGGTVSGTGLYQVAGFRPLAVSGIAELAKGAVGPLLAGRDRPRLQAVAGGAAVVGHNWSPFLGGAGGRGISPATGAMLAAAPVGAAVLLGGLVVGRLAGETALGALAADALLVPVLVAVHGRPAGWMGAAVVSPMLVKRLAGNAPITGSHRARILLIRLLYDRDQVAR